MTDLDGSCDVPSCPHPSCAYGLCMTHYRRVLRTGVTERGPVRLPVAPLAEVVDGRGGIRQVTRDSNTRDVYRRSVRRGWCGERWADRFCIRQLGTLPELVWGRAWFGEYAA